MRYRSNHHIQTKRSGTWTWFGIAKACTFYLKHFWCNDSMEVRKSHWDKRIYRVVPFISNVLWCNGIMEVAGTYGISRIDQANRVYGVL